MTVVAVAKKDGNEIPQKPRGGALNQPDLKGQQRRSGEVVVGQTRLRKERARLHHRTSERGRPVMDRNGKT